jgi:hypothetical protein
MSAREVPVKEAIGLAGETGSWKKRSQKNYEQFKG